MCFVSYLNALIPLEEMVDPPWSKGFTLFFSVAVFWVKYRPCSYRYFTIILRKLTLQLSTVEYSTMQKRIELSDLGCSNHANSKKGLPLRLALGQLLGDEL